MYQRGVLHGTQQADATKVAHILEDEFGNLHLDEEAKAAVQVVQQGQDCQPEEAQHVQDEMDGVNTLRQKSMNSCYKMLPDAF